MVHNYAIMNHYGLNFDISLSFILFIFAKNQLTMNNFRKDFLYLQSCYKQTADILRKQPCLVRTENLDNSLYTRTKTEVVHPTVYYCIHSASAGWVLTYTHWCELIFILCVQVVQNLQNRMKLVRTFFCA